MRRSLLTALLMVLSLCASPVLAQEHYDRLAHPQIDGYPSTWWRNEARRQELRAQREAARRTQAHLLHQTLRNGHIRSGGVHGSHHR